MLRAWPCVGKSCILLADDVECSDYRDSSGYTGFTVRKRVPSQRKVTPPGSGSDLLLSCVTGDTRGDSSLPLVPLHGVSDTVCCLENVSSSGRGLPNEVEVW